MLNKIFPEQKWSYKKAAAWSLCFVLLKLLIFLVAYYRVQSSGTEPNICGWDCGYYHEIATKGYALFREGHTSTLAFFPAFPLMVKFLTSIFQSENFAA